jgi:nucleoside-diphosphate-sugar epimerase
MAIYKLPNSIDDDVKIIVSESIDWLYLNGKTILITGASGFIPSYVVYTLLKLNETFCLDETIYIIALVRNKVKAETKFSSFLKNKYFHLIIDDVASTDIVKNIAVKIDIIIHAASQASPKYYGIDPVGTLKANSIGTINMLDLAKNNGSEKFLFISSGEVYGTLDNKLSKIREDYTGNVDITNVRSCYAESKRIGETMCVCWSHQYNLHVNMLRLSHTYGPGIELNDGRVFADFVKNIVQNEDIILTSDGKSKRGFVYITDMILALFRVLFYGENKQAYNVAADSEVTILELAKILCGIYPDKNIAVKFKNVVSPNYIRSSSTNVSLCADKIKKLGWRQKIQIEKGFKRMIESYRDVS